MANTNFQWRAALSAFAPLVLWIALILFFSGSRGSVDETSGIFRPLLEFFFPSATPEELIFYYGYVRKFIHFAVYAVLGFLAFRAFSADRCGRRTMLIAMGVSLAVALTDEYIQSLDPSRTGSVYDVALDMAGATSMIFVICVLRARRNQPVAAETSP